MAVSESIAIIFLGIASWMDIRRKCVYLPFAAAGAVVGIAAMAVQQDGRASVAFAGLLPGLCFLLIGIGTREAVGYGDGIIVLVLGIYLGLWRTAEVVLYSLAMASVWAVVLLVVMKKKKKDDFPFLPFLFIGCIISIIIKRGGVS